MCMKPIIIYNSRIPSLVSWFFPVAAITLWPFIFIRKGAANGKLINHENIHIAQCNELLVVGQALLYVLFFVVGLFRYRSVKLAYKNNPFEREAYDNQSNLKYLEERKWFAWRRYI